MSPELLELAQRQDGLLTLAQIEQAGHRHLVRRRLSSGEWIERQPCVVSPAGWTPTFEAQLTAIRLSVRTRGPDKGWCFSHTTAAHLLTLKVPDPPQMHVLLPITRTKLVLHDAVVHHTRAEPAVATVGHNPVAMPTLAVVQSASVLGRDDLLHLVEDMLRTGRYSVWGLRQLCRRGVSGARALRSVLEEVEQEGSDKWMRVLLRLLVAAGLPRPALEVPVHEGFRVYAVLDGLYEEANLALEVDDWETHGPRAASERDRQRDRWLERNYGYLTLRFTPREIREQPDRVVSDIADAYRRRCPHLSAS